MQFLNYFIIDDEYIWSQIKINLTFSSQLPELLFMHCLKFETELIIKLFELLRARANIRETECHVN